MLRASERVPNLSILLKLLVEKFGDTASIK